MVLHHGDLLKGRYKIIRELKSGGMGIVYLAEDITHGEQCVVKTPLCKGDAEDQLKIEKLRVEAQILSSVSHPNIVKYIDFFRQNNTDCLVLEYVKGDELENKFYNTPCSEEKAREYLKQILDAVEYLHKKQILHRDINPKNIFLTTEDKIVLIDFGAAKKGYISLNQTHTKIYTPGWAPREQVEGRPVPQSDIFAVGAVGYYLLTGDTPNGFPPYSPRKMNPNVSEDIDRIIRKATMERYQDRFSTAAEMKNALLGFHHPVISIPRIILGGKVYPLQKNVILIGRGGGNVRPDIVINDSEKYISRIHAKIYKDSSNQYWIEDCDSRNGVFVFINGRWVRKKKWALYDGDTIALCYSDTKGPYITFDFKMDPKKILNLKGGI